MEQSTIEQIRDSIIERMWEVCQSKKAKGYKPYEHVRGVNQDAILFYPAEGIFTYQDRPLPHGLAEHMIWKNMIQYQKPIFHHSIKLHYIRYVLKH